MLDWIYVRTIRCNLWVDLDNEFPDNSSMLLLFQLRDQRLVPWNREESRDGEP
jgi:hypothetical protein